MQVEDSASAYGNGRCQGRFKSLKYGESWAHEVRTGIDPAQQACRRIRKLVF
jgi:hypothetical protein